MKAPLVQNPNHPHYQFQLWSTSIMNVSERGCFGTGTFCHKDIFEILAQGHLCQNVYIALHTAKMYMCGNIHVTKYPCAEISQCHNNSVPIRPWCQNIPILKCSRAKMSWCRKVPVTKCPCQNVSCKISGAKINPNLYRGSLPYMKLVLLGLYCGPLLTLIPPLTRT